MILNEAMMTIAQLDRQTTTHYNELHQLITKHANQRAGDLDFLRELNEFKQPQFDVF